MPEAGGGKQLGISPTIRRHEGLNHSDPRPGHVSPRPYSGRGAGGCPTSQLLQSFKTCLQKPICRFLRFSCQKTSRPDNRSSPRLQLDEHRPCQLFRTKGPPNLVAGQRKPLSPRSQHAHLLLEIRFLKPFQDEAEARRLLIGRKSGNVQRCRVGHGFLRYNCP